VDTRPLHPAAARPHRSAAPALAASAPRPKLGVFPAPAPLSAEEQALARVVAQSSEEQRESFLRQQQQTGEPIRISSISIPPISISPPDEGKE
jgi:hypothetical protein